MSASNVPSSGEEDGARPFDYFVQWWWADLIAGTGLLLLLRYAFNPGGALDVVGVLQRDDRLAIYTDALQLVSLLAGFSGVAFANYLGMSGRKLSVVRAKSGADILRVWIAALLIPWLCAFTIIAAKVVDRGEDGGRWSWAIFYAAILVVGLQLTRLAWVFTQLALIAQQKPVPAMATTERQVTVRQHG